MFDKSRILLQKLGDKVLRVVLSYDIRIDDGQNSLTLDCPTPQEFKHQTEGLIDRIREVQEEGYKFFENLRKQRGW